MPQNLLRILTCQQRIKKEKADAQIRQRGISLTDPRSIQQNYATINQIYQSNGLPAAYNSDGTLITTVLNDEPFKAEFPNNIDLNISNRCKIGCKFCYQNCTLNGKDADIKKFIEGQKSGTQKNNYAFTDAIPLNLLFFGVRDSA